jgi:transcription antitermination factor NusG
MQSDHADGNRTNESRVETLTAEDSFSAHWFAVYTNTHHEKRVNAYFKEREIESFLPLYATQRQWKNRCAMKLELPLFPNYVFAHIARGERVRVLEIPGVLSLVGFGRHLTPLPDLEIEALRAGLSQRTVEPHPYLVVGERVRIKAGAMIGMEGVLLRKKNNFRVVLALDAIMQSVSIEVGAEDLEVARKGHDATSCAPNFPARSLSNRSEPECKRL